MREDTRIIDLTVGELKDILRSEAPKIEEKKERRLVYGLSGIAEIFNCSTSTAQRIKNSGKINKAITQVGRKIVVDAELALKLHNNH
ncbi:MAG: DUF3853 family protein [Petrimonas sp.]|nr:DUF3853 family protein [Petrimonas sp.]